MMMITMMMIMIMMLVSDDGCDDGCVVMFLARLPHGLPRSRGAT
jgi:hypothetical protein